MNLRQLLHLLRSDILHDRSDQIAGNTDQLWSDETLTIYINEAQRRMARRGLLIRDAVTPEVTVINTIAGQKHYTLHDSIIAVLSARCMANASLNLPEDTADLARAGHSALTTYQVPNSYFFDPSSLSALQPGKVVAFDTDESLQEDAEGTWASVTMRLYPTPDAAYLQPVHLRVIRGPTRELSEPTDIPEVPRDHHLNMLDWAAYLALRIVDRDMGDPDLADKFKNSFEQHCLDAKKEMMRKLFTPAPWGFGRNGFSYERN